MQQDKKYSADFIYKMKGIFVEDHKYYKEIGYYDFPQKDIKNQGYKCFYLQQ
jgi:hypothetical protein